MFQFKAEKYVPKFILNDKTGYAIAKAIEAGVQAMNDAIDYGVKRLYDVDSMPEWRLDEMAWEYNIPYDYKASIQIKREWVRNVQTLSRLYGTPDGITKYMLGYFDAASIQEAWQYSGSPFHFKMGFPDSWTPEKVEWATKAIKTVKNVRSVLDSYTFVANWRHRVFTGCALYTYESGTYQLPAVTLEGDWYMDESGFMLLDEDGVLLLVE